MKLVKSSPFFCQQFPFLAPEQKDNLIGQASLKQMYGLLVCYYTIF